MTRNEAIGCHMALATGDDAGAGSGLTAWRNGDAAYIAGELIPCDQLLAWDILPLNYTVVSSGAMTTSRVPDSWSANANGGIWRSKHMFQTCQFIYWLMQTVGTPTNEGTPASYNTHTLTIGNTNIPDWHGIHFERESISGQELRYDYMGLVPSDLFIECGESLNKWMATQTIVIPFAYEKAGSDIAAQTPRPTGTTGTIWKGWDHLITGNGGGIAPSGLTYNGNQLECNILRQRIHLHRDVKLDVPDANGIYTTGSMLGFDYTIELDVHPTGDLLYTVNRTKKESYAGDLDYIFSYTADATNDKITFTFDKLQLLQFHELNDYRQWFEGYTIYLKPLDTNSSLTVVGIDGLDNTHFENP